MNTQFEKNSINMAISSYRAREREKRLRNRLAVFFVLLCGVCIGLYTVLPAIPH